MEPLPEELSTLRNVIDGAKNRTDISLLKKLIQCVVDQAPPESVIAMAEWIYDRGVEIERNRRN